MVSKMSNVVKVYAGGKRAFTLNDCYSNYGTFLEELSKRVPPAKALSGVRGCKRARKPAGRCASIQKEKKR